MRSLTSKLIFILFILCIYKTGVLIYKISFINPSPDSSYVVENKLCSQACVKAKDCKEWTIPNYPKYCEYSCDSLLKLDELEYSTMFLCIKNTDNIKSCDIKCSKNDDI